MKENNSIQLYLAGKCLTLDIQTKDTYRFSEPLGVWKKESLDKLILELRLLSPQLSIAKINEEITKYLSVNRATFNNDGCFCFLNGYIKIGDKALMSYSKKTFYCPNVEYEYVADQVPVRFLKVLKEVFNDDQDKIDTLISYGALALNNSLNLSGVVLFVGEGANGKSLILDTIRKTLGSRVSNLSVSEIDDKYKAYQLVGATVNISEENEAVFTTSRSKLIKAFSSGTECVLEKKFKDPETHFIKVTFFFSLNDVPKFSEVNNAILRRVRVLNFNRTFSEKEQDLNLGKSLLEERSGIFDLFNDAYIKIVEKGEIEVSEKIKEDTEMALNSSSSVKLLFKNRYRVTGLSKHRITKKRIYEVYKLFCKRRGYEELNYQTFCGEVLNQFKDVKTGKVNVEGKRENCFVGIGLKVRRRRDVK